jgi:hypothetical protein
MYPDGLLFFVFSGVQERTDQVSEHDEEDYHDGTPETDRREQQTQYTCHGRTDECLAESEHTVL